MNTSSRSFITVVSGLPRSGTSMMMQMLEAAGLPALTDHVRAMDQENPRGYFELEAVKHTKDDPSWVADAVGKAVKVIYQLLSDLPAEYQYRVVFMRRNIAEVVCSQKAMLARTDKKGADVADQKMIDIFQRQLDKCDAWLAQQPHFQVLNVQHHDVINEPLAQAHSINDFLGLDLDVAAMASAVDPDLYRQRRR